MGVKLHTPNQLLQLGRTIKDNAEPAFYRRKPVFELRQSKRHSAPTEIPATVYEAKSPCCHAIYALLVELGCGFVIATHKQVLFNVNGDSWEAIKRELKRYKLKARKYPSLESPLVKQVIIDLPTRISNSF